MIVGFFYQYHILWKYYIIKSTFFIQCSLSLSLSLSIHNKTKIWHVCRITVYTSSYLTKQTHVIIFYNTPNKHHCSLHNLPMTSHFVLTMDSTTQCWYYVPDKTCRIWPQMHGKIYMFKYIPPPLSVHLSYTTKHYISRFDLNLQLCVTIYNEIYTNTV